MWGQEVFLSGVKELPDSHSFYSSVLQRSTLLTQSSLFIWKWRKNFSFQSRSRATKQTSRIIITIEPNSAYDCSRERFSGCQTDWWTTFISKQWNVVKLCSFCHWSLPLVFIHCTGTHLDWAGRENWNIFTLSFMSLKVGRYSCRSAQPERENSSHTRSHQLLLTPNRITQVCDWIVTLNRWRFSFIVYIVLCTKTWLNEKILRYLEHNKGRDDRTE